MWNKSTHYDIADLFAELQELDLRGVGLSVRTRSGPGGEKPEGYEKLPHVLERKARWARAAGVHLRAHVKAKKAEWEEENREKRTDRRRAQRRALRVGQRAADLDVVDCAGQ